jgi:hypothetical protein
VNHGVTNGQYHQPHEFYDMRFYPSGWRSTEYQYQYQHQHYNESEPSEEISDAEDAAKDAAAATSWVLPRTTLPFVCMASKGIAGIRLDTVSAASFHMLPLDHTVPPDASSNRSSFAANAKAVAFDTPLRGPQELPPTSAAASTTTTTCYVVDFGGIIQGGLNVTFAAGQAGQQVTVYAGETLYADGSVKWWEDNLNDTEYRDVWTLREGRQTITSHEYKEARYWQVCNAPEPPTHALVGGWRVWFPM